MSMLIQVKTEQKVLKWSTHSILHWNCLIKGNMLQYVHQWFDTQSKRAISIVLTTFKALQYLG